MDERRSVHERISVSIHRLQRRSSAVSGKGFRVLSNEIRRRLDHQPVPGGGGEGASGGAEACPNFLHEGRLEGQFDQTKRGADSEIHEAKLTEALKFSGSVNNLK